MTHGHAAPPGGDQSNGYRRADRDLRQLTLSWYRRTRHAQLAHGEAASRARRRETLLGASVVALSAIVGSAIVATIDVRPDTGWHVVAGLLSLLAGALAALQTFLRHGDLHDRLLLEVAIVEFPNVLDLTNERVLRDAVANVTAASDAVASRPYSQSLAAVLDQTTRGNAITDEIGRRAYSSGFSGIRFFGARAISDEELRHSLMQGAWAMWFEEEADLFAGLRAQPALLNLVGFHGAHVVRHVSRFRIDGGEWRDNPLFGCSPETIEQVHKREGLPVPPEFDPASWIAVEPHADSVRPTLFRP